MALELEPGTLIGGRFRLDRLLGKGGMGQVWAATHQVTSRSHALKLLNTPGASPWLETATQHCAVLTYPYESTRAHFSLGQAREAKGDTKGACSAYQVVLKRWGKAKPASLTATAARARVKALGCKS